MAQRTPWESEACGAIRGEGARAAEVNEWSAIPAMRGPAQVSPFMHMKEREFAQGGMGKWLMMAVVLGL